MGGGFAALFGQTDNQTMFVEGEIPGMTANAPLKLSTGWALNHRFEEMLGPLFLWSRLEDWVFVEHLYRARGAQSCF